MLALVLPGEMMALPHVGPAVTAGVFASTALEAVALAGRVGLRRRRLVQKPAQVDEVFLRSRALLEFRGPPLGDKLTRRHGLDRTDTPLPRCRSEMMSRCSNVPGLRFT